MGIRTAAVTDAESLTSLLEQLGYEGTQIFIKEKIEYLRNSPDEELVAYEKENGILGTDFTDARVL